MPILTKQFLSDIGINMSEEDYTSLAEHFEDTLEDRVINEVVDLLTPDQARELLQLREATDNQVNTWIVTNVPEFRQIVEDEIAILQGEIAESTRSN